MARPKVPGEGRGNSRNQPCPCGSGKKFKLCHGLEAVVAPPVLAETPTSTLLKLDLGCGNTPREGYEGVDLYGGKAKHRVDLFKFPWPFADNSCDELNLSHFMEHIPARWVEERDIRPTGWDEAARPNPDLDPNTSRFLGQDMMFAFFDECYRILRHEGWIYVVVPCARSNRAFQDPTHRRFIVEDTFYYFSAEWRKVNIPQYNVRCNFGFEVNHSVSQEFNLRAPEVLGDKIRHEWNVAFDLHAKMKALKQ